MESFCKFEVISCNFKVTNWKTEPKETLQYVIYGSVSGNATGKTISLDMTIHSQCQENEIVDAIFACIDRLSSIFESKIQELKLSIEPVDDDTFSRIKTKVQKRLSLSKAELIQISWH